MRRRDCDKVMAKVVYRTLVNQMAAQIKLQTQTENGPTLLAEKSGGLMHTVVARIRFVHELVSLMGIKVQTL